MKDNLANVIRLGVDYEDAVALRRISMTLRRWFEYGCGTGDGLRTFTIERDESGKPFMRLQYPSKDGYVDRRWPTPDRETGARKRLARIMARYQHLIAYVQPDCRGCSLYLVKPEQIPEGGDIACHYPSGVAVW